MHTIIIFDDFCPIYHFGAAICAEVVFSLEFHYYVLDVFAVLAINLPAQGFYSTWTPLKTTAACHCKVCAQQCTWHFDVSRARHSSLCCMGHQHLVRSVKPPYQVLERQGLHQTGSQLKTMDVSQVTSHRVQHVIAVLGCIQPLHIWRNLPPPCCVSQHHTGLQASR